MHALPYEECCPVRFANPLEDPCPPEYAAPNPPVIYTFDGLNVVVMIVVVAVDTIKLLCPMSDALLNPAVDVANPLSDTPEANKEFPVTFKIPPTLKFPLIVEDPMT